MSIDLEQAGSTCPAPMTRAALIALRNAGGLSKDCDYVVTDHVQGRLVAGTTIHLQAVAADKLSENVSVNTTYDNEAWAGVYDLDRGLVLELTDNRGNVAKGIYGIEVSNFDWGNGSYTNVVVDNATLTVNIGNTAPKFNIIVRMNGTLNLTGFTGSINRFLVENLGTANFTNANGTWRLSRVSDNSMLNCSDYTGGGDNYYFELLHGSSVNFSSRTSAVTLRNSTLYAMIVNAASVTTGALDIQACPDLKNSTITQSVGAGAMSLTRLEMDGQAAVMLGAGGGTLSINNTRVASAATVSKLNAGALNLNNCDIDTNSLVTNDGTGTVTHTRLRASQVGQVVMDTGSTIDMTTTDVTVETQGVLRGIGAVVTGAFDISTTQIASGSFIYKRAAHTGALNIAQCELIGESGLNFTSGNRGYTVTRMDMNGASRANFTGTGAVTDVINELRMETRATLAISCSGAANSITYSSIHGLTGYMSFSGTTGAQSVTRVKCDDGTVLIDNCTVNLNLTLCSTRDNGRIDCRNMAVAKSVQFCDVSQLGVLNINGATGGGAVRATVMGEAQFNQTGAAGAALGVTVLRGVLNQNGGSLTDILKGGGGTLTTGNFAHSNVVFISNTNFTMTAANTNRALYTGLAPGAYAANGQVV